MYGFDLSPSKAYLYTHSLFQKKLIYVYKRTINYFVYVDKYL